LLGGVARLSRFTADTIETGKVWLSETQSALNRAGGAKPARQAERTGRALDPRVVSALDAPSRQIEA
jgi:hypothetical protein